MGLSAQTTGQTPKGNHATSAEVFAALSKAPLPIPPRSRPLQNQSQAHELIGGSSKAGCTIYQVLSPSSQVGRCKGVLSWDFW